MSWDVLLYRLVKLVSSTSCVFDAPKNWSTKSSLRFKLLMHVLSQAAVHKCSCKFCFCAAFFQITLSKLVLPSLHSVIQCKRLIKSKFLQAQRSALSLTSTSPELKLCVCLKPLNLKNFQFKPLELLRYSANESRLSFACSHILHLRFSHQWSHWHTA